MFCVGGNYSEETKWYRRAADLGYARAQYELGDRYSSEEKHDWYGLPYDMEITKEWYRKAAAQGHEYAKQELEKLGAD